MSSGVRPRRYTTSASGRPRATAAMDSAEVRGQYVKLATDKGKRPRDLAVSDYFKGIDLLKGA